MNSALLVAPDLGRSADPTESATDGRITAQQIVNTWDLNADLVVLSACETGLGRNSQGEGYLGFSQALFVKGARAVVLSLWKVDDEATERLMRRFYENLLGRREGLSGPMPKALALGEAKAWLRTQAVEPATAVTRSEPKRLRPVAEPSPRGRYEHPYYWTGFILVGDPY